MGSSETRMTNIVLVEPTNADEMNPSLQLRGNTLEPYAIESIASYLEHAGFNNVHVLQQYLLSDDDLLRQIAEIHPGVVGFSVLSRDYQRALKLARELKQQSPAVFIVFGGYHPTLNIHDTLSNDCVDFVVVGEGEITFRDLCLSLIKHDGGLENIPGIAYKKNADITINPPRKRFADLDSLPLAKRNTELLQRSRNWNLAYPAPLNQRAVAQIGFSRGCPFQCSFCVSPLLWCKGTDPAGVGAVTYRSARQVVEEIKMLKEQYGVNFIYFNDLTINASEERLRELCRTMIEHGLHDSKHDTSGPDDIQKNIHWFCLAKIGMSAELASLMAQAGCSKIGFGIESFYKQGQREMRKPYKGYEEIKETLENTDAAGIINRGYIILGWPHETEESITATIDGLLSTKVDQIRVAYFTPFPGTDLYAEYKKNYLLMEENYSKFDGDTPVVKCEQLTKNDLIAARKRIITSFYNSPLYHQRCRDKIRRFPRLRESYRSFAEELFDLSKGTINLKGVL